VYFPFGSTRTGSVSTDKKFTGQRLDGTGLYYYGARYYDATIGRFISPDTASPALMNPQSFNKYTYCSNNPLKYNDPTGHWSFAASFGFKISVNLLGYQFTWMRGIAFDRLGRENYDSNGSVRDYNGITKDGGPSLIGASATIFYRVTQDYGPDCHTVEDWNPQNEVKVGGSLYAGEGGSFDYIVGRENDGEIYKGYEIQLGVGIGGGIHESRPSEQTPPEKHYSGTPTPQTPTEGDNNQKITTIPYFTYFDYYDYFLRYY
jgi:RHS repeat-associated protein